MRIRFLLLLISTPTLSNLTHFFHLMWCCFRKTIITLTHEVISSNGGHLSSLSYEDTIQRVTQHILDLSEDEYVNQV